MFLATTADQRFWKKDEKLLFLGEWCKIYNQKNIWLNIDYEVLPYHWDDRERLYKDYLYLDSVYERYLKLLAERLNHLHNVDHSIRYWRIIIGPWLRYFIEILFDRYLSVRTAIDSDMVTGTWIIPKAIEKWIPKDFATFRTWSVSDEFNQYLYSRLIENIGDIPFHPVDVEISPLFIESSNFTQSLHSDYLVRRLMKIFILSLPSRLNQVVFVESYLNIWDQIKLQLSMGQLPFPFAQLVVSDDVALKMPIRRKKLTFKTGENEFESILDWFIVDQIPKVYIEGYDDMHERSLDAFPKKPKVIFTAISWFINEGFKFWAAHQIERGAKLVGTQHGGHGGMALWRSEESHEISIYDRYYTWGWRIEGQDKLVPMPSGKLAILRKKVQPDPRGHILWVEMSLPRYSYLMYSLPVGPQMLEYLKEQYRFAKSVSPYVHRLLLLRLYIHEYGWNEAARWADMDCTLNRYQGTKTIEQQLNESRLFIGTYNGTTYLETFTANFPTVIYWNPEQWELRQTALPYFDRLRLVGILHDTPESAAAKVNEIYEDPITWWNQPAVQEAKNQFCKQFARTSESWLKEWKIELLSLSNKMK